MHWAIFIVRLVLEPVCSIPGPLPGIGIRQSLLSDLGDFISLRKHDVLPLSRIHKVYGAVFISYKHITLSKSVVIVFKRPLITFKVYMLRGAPLYILKGCL